MDSLSGVVSVLRHVRVAGGGAFTSIFSRRWYAREMLGQPCLIALDELGQLEVIIPWDNLNGFVACLDLPARDVTQIYCV